MKNFKMKFFFLGKISRKFMQWKNKCDIYSKIISQIKVIVAEMCLADNFYLLEDYIHIDMYIYTHTSECIYTLWFKIKSLIINIFLRHRIYSSALVICVLGAL